MERRIDELGRVVVPTHIRRKLELTPQTPVKFEIIAGGVFITRARPTCIICNSSIGLNEVADKKYICDACRNKLLSKTEE